ncbi:MAG: hypothetical protein PUC12_16750 [Clostridiales bacterium]|nr:hypothetical protein [Clostridiales bacterium]
MEKVKQMKRMKQMVGDACVYVISIISVAVFMVEILNWMMMV